MKPDVCPNCGTLVPEEAKACPECGSDEETGWSDHAQAQRLDLPDDDFDYDAFVKEEFGGGEGKRSVPQVKPHGLSWLWWIVGLLLLAALAFGFLRGVL